MKLYQYLMLEEQLQYQTIWEIGKYIETIEIDGVRFLLYAINDFFVEVQYRVRTNEIIGKNQFKQGEHLDKYLPQLK
jgi:hypothetical protein